MTVIGVLSFNRNHLSISSTINRWIPDQVTFENFVNRYFDKYGFRSWSLTATKTNTILENPLNTSEWPIQLDYGPKSIKRLMPVYTAGNWHTWNITKIVVKISNAFLANQIFKELSSEKEYDQKKDLFFLILVNSSEQDDHKNRATSSPISTLNISMTNWTNIKAEFVSCREDKNLVYSLNKL